MSFIKNVATVIMALNISLHAEDVKQSLQIMDNEVNINYHEGEKINKTCEYVAKNTSGKVINIREIKTTCGCTIAGASSYTIAPGEEATIFVNINIADPEDPINSKTVIIETDEGTANYYKLNVYFSKIIEAAVSPNIIKLNQRKKSANLVVNTLSIDNILIGVDSTDYCIVPKLNMSNQKNPYNIDVFTTDIQCIRKAKVILLFKNTNGSIWQQSVPVDYIK